MFFVLCSHQSIILTFYCLRRSVCFLCSYLVSPKRIEARYQTLEGWLISKVRKERMRREGIIHVHVRPWPSVSETRRFLIFLFCLFAVFNLIFVVPALPIFFCYYVLIFTHREFEHTMNIVPARVILVVRTR